MAMSRGAKHIAVIGVDGSGKSSCYEGLLKKFSDQYKVAGIGDQVVVQINGKMEYSYLDKKKIQKSFSIICNIKRGASFKPNIYVFV